MKKRNFKTVQEAKEFLTRILGLSDDDANGRLGAGPGDSVKDVTVWYFEYPDGSGMPFMVEKTVA